LIDWKKQKKSWVLLENSLSSFHPFQNPSQKTKKGY
jgi:hypothetical protein